MSRVSKVLGFSVPPAMVKVVEGLAKQERRTKSELFREMVRVYQRYCKHRDRAEMQWVADLVQQSEAGPPPVSVQMLTESRKLSREGASQARKLGIRTDLDSIVSLVHARRKARRTA